LDVFQHQIVLGLINSQSCVDAADDQVVRQKVSPICWLLNSSTRTCSPLIPSFC
jgi:hypothetical protein